MVTLLMHSCYHSDLLKVNQLEFVYQLRGRGDIGVFVTLKSDGFLVTFPKSQNPFPVPPIIRTKEFADQLCRSAWKS